MTTASAASAGSGFAMAAMFAVQALTARTQAKASLRVANAQAAAGASTALSTARTTAAATALAAVQGSLRRQAFLAQGGTAMEAIMANAINADRAEAHKSVETQLSQAESDGARTALHGASSVSTAADAVDAAAALRYARASRQTEEVRRISNYAYAQHAEALAEQVWSGAPSAASVPQYTPTPQAVQIGSVPSLTGVALTGLLKAVAVDPQGWADRVSTWFSPAATPTNMGTPQAGP